MSEQAKHTPGEWTAEMSSSGVFSIQSQTGGEHGGLLVIASRNEHRNVTAMHANARLIAAAPDLLASLRDMVDWLDDGNRQLSESASADVLKARAALSKATVLPQP